jgi:peptide chain release factor
MELMLQITSGRGPAEAQRAVAHLARHLVAEAGTAGFTARLLEAEAGPRERDCLLSALLEIGGADAAALRAWCGAREGTHRWVCRSPFRPDHGRKNWFVGVRRLPEPGEIRLRPEEVRFEACRASGPGGQHVNRTNSAVRATWVPGGLSVAVSGERSQHQNRRIALARLQAAVDDRNAGLQREHARGAWQGHNELERGREVRTYRGEEFAEE